MDNKNNKERENPLDSFVKDILTEVSTAEAILLRDVVAFGNSAHVNVGKEFAGKKARIIINDKSKIRDDFYEIKKISGKKDEDNKKS